MSRFNNKVGTEGSRTLLKIGRKAEMCAVCCIDYKGCAIFVANLRYCADIAHKAVIGRACNNNRCGRDFAQSLLNREGRNYTVRAELLNPLGKKIIGAKRVYESGIIYRAVAVSSY